MRQFSELGIKPETSGFSGDKIKVANVLNRQIIVNRYDVRPSQYKQGKECLYLQLTLDNVNRVLFVGSATLINTLRQIPESAFPFTATIINDNNRLEFK